MAVHENTEGHSQQHVPFFPFFPPLLHFWQNLHPATNYRLCQFRKRSVRYLKQFSLQKPSYFCLHLLVWLTWQSEYFKLTFGNHALHYFWLYCFSFFKSCELTTTCPLLFWQEFKSWSKLKTVLNCWGVAALGPVPLRIWISQRPYVRSERSTGVGRRIRPCGSAYSTIWWKAHWVKSQEALAEVQSAMK